MKKFKYLLSSSLLVFTSSSYAMISDWPLWQNLKGFELSAAAGINWATADDTSLVVSQTETDSVNVSNVTKNGIIKIGIGYHFFEEQLKQRTFFTDLLVELNIYRNSETINGDVWQYQLPQFNNFSFEAPVATTRAMIDIKPGLYTKYRTTIYPIVGAGVAWSDVSYIEHITNSGVDPASYHSLGTDTNVNFTYDLGAGLRVDLIKHLSASLEYVYNYLVNLNPAAETTTKAQLESPPSFTVYNQSVLLGINWEV